MTPLVSIIIPTFDRPRYLQEAIEAVLAQTYPNIESTYFRQWHFGRDPCGYGGRGPS